MLRELVCVEWIGVFFPRNSATSKGSNGKGARVLCQFDFPQQKYHTSLKKRSPLTNILFPNLQNPKSPTMTRSNSKARASRIVSRPWKTCSLLLLVANSPPPFLSSHRSQSPAFCSAVRHCGSSAPVLSSSVFRGRLPMPRKSNMCSWSVSRAWSEVPMRYVDTPCYIWCGICVMRVLLYKRAWLKNLFMPKNPTENGKNIC